MDLARGTSRCSRTVRVHQHEVLICTCLLIGYSVVSRAYPLKSMVAPTSPLLGAGFIPLIISAS